MPSKECAECGERPAVARGLCDRCYSRAKYSGKFKKGQGSVVNVVADFAYIDRHPQAPGGQRLAVYTCPACQHRHLVSWLPVDPHPGLKTATCRAISAASNAAIPMFEVLAPPAERIFASEAEANVA